MRAVPVEAAARARAGVREVARSHPFGAFPSLVRSMHFTLMDGRVRRTCQFTEILWTLEQEGGRSWIVHKAKGITSP